MGDEYRSHVGNNQKLDIETNSGVINVIGNKCVVTVSKNEGQIVMTGNNGHLQVIENVGSIRYTGNNGLVEVGSTSKGIGRVVYTGNGGNVRRLKSNGVNEKCSVGKNNSKNSRHGPKLDEGNKTKEIHRELRVNGVEMCINPKSKQSATKESVDHEKLKRTSTTGSCCQQARKLWKTASVKSTSKTTRVVIPHPTSLHLINVNNFQLENWCVNLATELVAL